MDKYLNFSGLKEQTVYLRPSVLPTDGLVEASCISALVRVILQQNPGQLELIASDVNSQLFLLQQLGVKCRSRTGPCFPANQPTTLFLFPSDLRHTHTHTHL